MRRDFGRARQTTAARQAREGGGGGGGEQEEEEDQEGPEGKEEEGDAELWRARCGVLEQRLAQAAEEGGAAAGDTTAAALRHLSGVAAGVRELRREYVAADAELTERARQLAALRADVDELEERAAAERAARKAVEAALGEREEELLRLRAAAAAAPPAPGPKAPAGDAAGDALREAAQLQAKLAQLDDELVARLARVAERVGGTVAM